MTISTEPATLSYNGDGSTVNFAITWKYFAKSHVVATLRSTTGTETVWALTTNYTLTAAGVDAGGTLTAVTAPASGEKLVITLEPPNTQESSLPLGGPFPSASVEDALDLSAQRDSKFATLLNRTFRVPVTDTKSGSDLEFPIDTDRSGKFLAFDADGDPIASAGTTEVPVSSFMETVLDDTTAAAARSTLGLGTAAVENLSAMPDITMSGASIIEAEGAAVASATTTEIWATDGNTRHITGTTTITSLGTAPQAGMWQKIIFDGILTLTHGANLNLPGSANITTAADDFAWVYADTTTQHDVLYFKKDGTAVVVAATTQPAFAVYMNAAQTINDNTSTKIVFDTEAFDTNTNFDSTTNYRFTPTVEGYYQINVSARYSATADDYYQVSIYKNGVSVGDLEFHATITDGIGGMMSRIIYMNGSTDYIEFYTYQNNAANTTRSLAGASNGGTYASGMKL